MMGRVRSLWRKGAQLAEDPTLRRWLWGVATRQHAMLPPPRQTGAPPYLRPGRLAGQPALGSVDAGSGATPPSLPLTVLLPGATLTLRPGGESALFARQESDLETQLAIHRFAWLPLAPALDKSWVSVLWRKWCENHGSPDSSWAWHPYTAAERAINILDAARRVGAPGIAPATVPELVQHAYAIHGNLEYFGEHYTGNHLANNGRGLFRIGLALEWPDCADVGGEILLNEAARLFTPSGILREGSTHYHALLTRNYIDSWLAARRYGHRAAEDLAQVAQRALAALDYLTLPGGMPLIGDISPDCPPAYLAGLVSPAASVGWTSHLDSESRTALRGLSALRPAPAASPIRDGWLRFDLDPWQGLWHLPPAGWAPMPGHGHQDAGSFELHWRGTPLFIDPGRGRYGEVGEAAYFRSAQAHNSLTIDDQDPYPPNRPYYSDEFRHRAGGGPGLLQAEGNDVEVGFNGYKRLGLGRVLRRWQFADGGFTLTDRVEGRGERHVRRRLVTPLPVETDRRSARIQLPNATLRISGDNPITVAPITRWTAYGQGRPATQICIDTYAPLPWTGTLAFQVIAS